MAGANLLARMNSQEVGKAMNTYSIRYLCGPNMNLSYSQEDLVQADSIDEALALKSSWPVERRWDETSAWSKNPGTSMYYVEAWEATQLKEES
jgi:hypothetical protein